MITNVKNETEQAYFFEIEDFITTAKKGMSEKAISS